MPEQQIMTHLCQRKGKSDRKPSVLRDTCQIGKTTMVNAFDKEIDNYLSFKLDVESDSALFERDMLVHSNVHENNHSTIIHTLYY